MGAAVLLAASTARAEGDRIQVEHDAERFTTRVVIRAQGGRVAWSDVLRGLARARGYDDTALAGVLPDGSVPIGRFRWRLAAAGLDLALGRGIDLSVIPPEGPGGEPRLVIQLDRAALLASQRRLKARLRKAFSSGLVPASRRPGLVFRDPGPAPPRRPDLLVIIHGLESDPEAAQVLLSDVPAGEFPQAAFRYWNDQPVADSAKTLARELAQYARERPESPVRLVTHSMGGLVARAVIEDPELDPGNVRQLIMVCPPNHGSQLARFAFALDLAEHLRDSQRREEVGLLSAIVEDGLSEAAGDLTPGSPLLRRLNSRPRNPQVHYTIILGTGGPLEEGQLAGIRQGFSRAGAENRWVRFFGPKVLQWLEDLDEVVRGRGDGAVAVRRGRLEGVDDVLVLPFGHVEVLRNPPQGAVREVRRAIWERLRQAG